MKANQFYRQWVSDYRKEKNDRSGEPIQDGDLLDWIAEKFEAGEFKQLNKPVVMQAEGSGTVTARGHKHKWHDISETEKVCYMCGETKST